MKQKRINKAEIKSAFKTIERAMLQELKYCPMHLNLLRCETTKLTSRMQQIESLYKFIADKILYS